MAEARSILDLLLEIQALDRVPRIGYAMRGISDPESVSEHVFHVIFLVWALADREADIDRSRAVEMALLHDLAEVRFGDLPRTAAHYLPPGAKAQAERAALDDLLSPLASQSAALLEEYQEAKTAEARFVSVCDKLQLLLKAHVYGEWGSGAVEEFFGSMDRFDDGGFESVRQLVAELRELRSPQS